VSDVSEEELRVGRVGRCGRGREVRLLGSFREGRGRVGVIVRFVERREEIVGRSVDPSDTEVRSDWRSVSDDVMVFLRFSRRRVSFRVLDLLYFSPRGARRLTMSFQYPNARNSSGVKMLGEQKADSRFLLICGRGDSKDSVQSLSLSVGGWE
jgi:hypothetical protein